MEKLAMLVQRKFRAASILYRRANDEDAGRLTFQASTKLATSLQAHKTSQNG